MDMFKLPVDFEDSMPRTQRSERQYASLIAGIARGLALRPLNAPAVARGIEQGSRLSGDAARLTLQLRLVQDLLREANHYAAEAGAGRIGVVHLAEAVRMHIHRCDRVRERSYEQVGELAERIVNAKEPTLLMRLAAAIDSSEEGLDLFRRTARLAASLNMALEATILKDQNLQ